MPPEESPCATLFFRAKLSSGFWVSWPNTFGYLGKREKGDKLIKCHLSFSWAGRIFCPFASFLPQNQWSGSCRGHRLLPFRRGGALPLPFCILSHQFGQEWSKTRKCWTESVGNEIEFSKWRDTSDNLSFQLYQYLNAKSVGIWLYSLCIFSTGRFMQNSQRFLLLSNLAKWKASGEFWGWGAVAVLIIATRNGQSL